MADQTNYRASEQLDFAISLFFKGRSIDALKVAAEADDPFAKAMFDMSEQNFLDWKYETEAPLHAVLHGRPPSKEDFIKDENRALTAARHMASASKSSDAFDFEDAAYSMIVRACWNSDRLGLPRTAKMREFDDYFHENVVGLESDD